MPRLEIIDIPAIIATCIGVAITIPQLRKSFKKGAHADDVAIGSWYLLLSGEVFWAVNSVLHKLTVNLASSIINVALLIILVLRLRYLQRNTK
jgi:Flp pilus assembly protein TadB